MLQGGQQQPLDRAISPEAPDALPQEQQGEQQQQQQQQQPLERRLSDEAAATQHGPLQQQLLQPTYTETRYAAVEGCNDAEGQTVHTSSSDDGERIALLGRTDSGSVAGGAQGIISTGEEGLSAEALLLSAGYSVHFRGQLPDEWERWQQQRHALKAGLQVASRG